jgi:hypothetical protein
MHPKRGTGKNKSVKESHPPYSKLCLAKVLQPSLIDFSKISSSCPISVYISAYTALEVAHLLRIKTNLAYSIYMLII